jgi:hypothetical protein
MLSPKADVVGRLVSPIVGGVARLFRGIFGLAT